MPCPGLIRTVHLPGGNGVRVDTHIYGDYKVPANYDSMLMKLIVYDKDREAAIAKMQSAWEKLSSRALRRISISSTRFWKMRLLGPVTRIRLLLRNISRSM